MRFSNLNCGCVGSSFISLLAYLGVLCALFFVLAGCAGKQGSHSEGFVPLGNKEAKQVIAEIGLQHQGVQSWNELSVPLRRSLAFVNKKPANSVAIRSYGLELTWKDLRDSLELLEIILPHLDQNPEMLLENFQLLRLAPGPKYTSYYEPAIEASLTRTEEYRYPLYAMPEDLQMLNLGKFHPRWKGQRLVYRVEDGKAVPYFDRSEIDGKGLLGDKGLEIAWAKDPVDIFFLQIQGSGRLLFSDADGERELHVLYAGKNGHKYVSLGRVMKEKGLLAPDNISMQSIRQWLANHPDESQKLLNVNPSYVFFRLAESGPFGSINEALTPMVSLATDRKVLPLGGVMLFTVPLPEQDAEGAFISGEPFTGVGFAQDTGGAIKGQRIDIFSGYGSRAEWIGGHMNAKGEVYLLLPKK